MCVCVILYCSLLCYGHIRSHEKYLSYESITSYEIPIPQGILLRPHTTSCRQKISSC